MALEREMETYRKRLPELKGENEGRFVLIQGDKVVDIFTSYEDALKVGYEKFGLNPFLVKKIEAVEQAQLISRFVDPLALKQPA
ncbi:MAG TPA: hypothetical protein VFR03_14955 [Thermoanaerobaculia bacterium]|nr:hypothetical protein [Thermoanaerobaculia bacterium]